VAELLRQDSDTRGIPLIFLTAVVSEEETQQQKNLIGGEHFIAKPVKIKELLRVIHQVTA